MNSLNIHFSNPWMSIDTFHCIATIVVRDHPMEMTRFHSKDVDYYHDVLKKIRSLCDDDDFHKNFQSHLVDIMEHSRVCDTDEDYLRCCQFLEYVRNVMIQIHETFQDTSCIFIAKMTPHHLLLKQYRPSTIRFYDDRHKKRHRCLFPSLSHHFPIARHIKQLILSVDM